MAKTLLKLVREYRNQNFFAIDAIESTIGSRLVDFPTAISKVIGLLEGLTSNNSIFLIGNGGSTAIASESMNRFWKFCGLRAFSLNDPVMITSTANDYGWGRVYQKPLGIFGRSGDILIAISSSGKSKNILNAVSLAKTMGLTVITLSGFKPDNPLRRMGDVNFYVPATVEYLVPSTAYRHTERAHLFILDCILDICLLKKEGKW